MWRHPTKRTWNLECIATICNQNTGYMRTMSQCLGIYAKFTHFSMRCCMACMIFPKKNKKTKNDK